MFLSHVLEPFGFDLVPGQAAVVVEFDPVAQIGFEPELVPELVLYGFGPFLATRGDFHLEFDPVQVTE